MKVKKIVTLALCSALLLSTGVQVEAKDYYQKSYGSPKEGYGPEYIPYEKRQVIDGIDLDLSSENKARSVAGVKDFNQDGKKEKLELCVKPINDEGKAKVIIKLNGKTVAIQMTINGEYGISTYKLGTSTIAVLSWGGWDECNNLVAYEWKGNTFKKFKVLDGSIGNDCGITKDKKSKKRVFYIQHNEQLSNHYGEKWPKNVMKKYKKYAKKKATSVTRIVYERYICKSNRLKKLETDNYYYVSDAYN